MSNNKRKRSLEEKHELQLPIETKQHIKKLFEKKFTFRKPCDGSWSFPQDDLLLDKQKFTPDQSQTNQSESSSFSCAESMVQSESLDESRVPEENSFMLKDLWTEDKFIEMKNELNKLKNNLNDKDMISWHQHTRSVNLAGNIAAEIQQGFRPELCTQAWCKFYEIATTYLEIHEKEFLYSVHLCEAPGAFVTSLNHFMLSTGYQGDWDWVATTLNPYYEGNDNGHMIGDDRFIRHTRDNWYFGVDNTGDLMSWKNVEGLQRWIGDRRVDLVTADGSIDCQGDPAEQEDVVSRLQHCETLTALQLLSPGGNFVLKMFTMLECKAISLMCLLNCVFEEVHVFKPCTSKGGNSEVYVVCQKYKWIDNHRYLKLLSSAYFDREPEGCLFSRSQIPASFLSQHTECTSFFKELQMTSIQRNLDLYKKFSEEEEQILEAEKQFCTECFLQRYRIVPMVYQWRVMKYKKKSKNNAVSTNKVSKYEKIASNRKNEGRFCGSFEDRLLQTGLSWKQKVNEYETYNISEEEFVTWVESPHGVLDGAELDKFQTAFGEPVSKIESSRFCYGKLIQQTQEIIKNVKLISNAEQMEKNMLVEKKAKRLRKILAAHREGREVLLEDTEQDVELSLNIPYVDPAMRKSSLFCALKDMATSAQTEAKSVPIVEVQPYCICSKVLDEKFELNEQTDLLSCVGNIIETCPKGGCVIIEMRSCLTRMTAGLIYLLYRCFHKIGFLSHHGDLLTQYLVCLSCNHPLSRYDVKGYLEKFCSGSKDETGYSRLEVVPVDYLIDDPQFCGFLQKTNTHLLQSFITSVVEQERTLLTQKAANT